MQIRRFFQVLLVTGALAASSVAFADSGSATTFIEGRQQKITELLKSNAPPAKISGELDRVLDYDELVRRCFKEHWDQLTPDQRNEIGGLLKRLVQKNYKKNLTKTLKYTVTYKGEQEAGGGTWRVKTSAQSDNKREPAFIVHYIVKKGGDGYQIIDIITENSSLTQNYYTQFHKMLTNPNEGYPHLKKKVEEKLNKN